MLHWLDGFIHSSGFGGLAAVFAAAIAYRAATRAGREQTIRADEDRWWDQAKWATEQLAGDDNAVEVGVATFQFLLDYAPDSQAAAFVRAAVQPVLHLPLAPDVDADALPGAQLDQGQEADDVNDQ